MEEGEIVFLVSDLEARKYLERRFRGAVQWLNPGTSAALVFREGGKVIATLTEGPITDEMRDRMDELIDD